MQMKKIIAFFITSALLVTFICRIPAGAVSSTAYNYTVSVDGKWIRTQDAYLPCGVLLKEAGLSQPQDIFIKGDEIYIADSGNARVLVYNMKNKSVRTVGDGIFTSPSGVFVSADDTVYVADSKAPAVFILSPSGKLLRTIGKPDSYLFGKNSVYAPKNVSVSSQGNIYVVGEGAHEGLMQFDFDGTFQGYFAANKRSLTFLERVQEIIYTDVQKRKQLSRIAQPIYNIDMTSQDLIYSVTQAADRYSAGADSGAKTHNLVQLHNLGGNDIFPSSLKMRDEWNFVDIASGIYSNCYALTQTGLIYEYDSSGELVFSFGGRAMADDKNGLITDAVAIDVDGEGYIYVLDRERALIQIFMPTDFAIATQRAIYYLDTGNYEDSEDIWNEVLKLNGMSRIAHLGLGKTLLRQQRYSEALKQFKIANDTENYSAAFWELRSAWLDRNILYLSGAVLLVFIGFIFYGKYRKRHPSLAHNKFIGDVLYIGNILRHPVDSQYYLNRGERGSVKSATVLYLMAFAVFGADMLLRGFTFRTSLADTVSPFSLMAGFSAAVGLFVIGNYMVSSINDGRGSLKNVYITTAYSLAPYICLTPVIIALTYIMSLNERFLVSFPWTLILIWTGVMIFISVSETHAYSFRATVKNLFLTIFFMVVCVVVAALVYIFWKQIIIFISEVFGEVGYRAVE